MKRITYNSPVVLDFTVLALLALILNALTGGLANTLVFSVYRSSFLDPLFYVRLVGHILGHSGFSHYAGNFTMILLLGPMVEERYGSKNLFIMIVATALVTGILQVALFPDSALLGASGIVYMLILLSSATNFRKGEIPLTTLVVAVLYIGEEIMSGVLTIDNISQFAHIIGGLCGFAFGMALGPKGSH